jgi:5'(3')-deoxyribonucleotidase
MAQRKRLLIDVDEVLVDFQGPAFDLLEQHFGKKFGPEDCEVWDMFTLFTPEEKAKVVEEIEKPGWCRALKVKEGAVEAVAELRKLVDVYAVTSHFTSPTWVHERDAQLMEDFGFQRREIVHTSAKFLVSGEYMLDDRPANLESWKAEHPEGIAMLWHIPNTRKLGMDDIRMKSWQEVIDRIKSTLNNDSLYDLLEEREWSRESNPEGNYCPTCGASARGSDIPTHKANCRLHNILEWHRARSR